ncbi:AsmA family protein [Hymenobacter metallilatus]|uniref:DUF748 domain-containing protein n=1 Tax=Hymenobacter metallilatus TaxID=2493666 RepID=A0A428JGT5_9BACT|nr:hypothetical protein [Hymenobacter metallilatus]RSK31748.1 hypothetical protein EI290_13030 [Hymenobacter metallilatus]
MPSTPSPTLTATPAPRRRWVPWLAAGAMLLLLVWGGLTWWLDPWLQRTVEQRVLEASQGRYHLRIGRLRTHLWPLGAEAQAVRVRTVAAAPDSQRLPRVELAVGRIRIAGVGWTALLRRSEVIVDSLVLESVAVQLRGLPAGAGTKPLHKQLPVAGLRIGWFAVRHLRGSYGSPARPWAQVADASLALQDVRLSAAGAADSGRIGYARQAVARVRGLLARVPGHTVRLVGLEASTVKRRLLVDSLLIRPLQPITDRRSPTVRIHLALPRLLLSGLDGARLAHRHFQADTLRILSPQLALTLPARKPPSLHEVLQPYLRVCRLQALLVVDGRVRVAGTELAPAVAGVRLQGASVQVLPYAGRPQGMYYARQWKLQTGRVTATLNAPYYHLSWQGLQADSRRGHLRLAQVLVVPTLSVVELARRKGHQAAHVSARLPELLLTGLDFPAAINQGELKATTLLIRNARVSTRSDGRFPMNPAISRVTPEALGRLPFRFALQRLQINRATLTMLYRAPRQAQPGTMQITRFGGTLRNLSNDPARMSAAHPLTGEATGWLQGQCRARLELRANLLDSRGYHTISGTFGAAPLAILNSMTVPTRGLKFRSGQIRQIRFRMSLNKTEARGTMWGEYTSLNLQRLNRQNQPGVLHRIETTLINGLVIRDDNPRRPGGAVVPGRIRSDRERRYSVFSLWRQGLVSGLLTSAGVPGAIAKKLSEAE